MHEYTKRQVEIWNEDMRTHGGYFYSSNPPYSAKVAHARISREIIKSIPADTRTIIDFGCGDGMYTAELALYFPQAQIVALDPAAVAIEIAKKQFPTIEFSVADLLDTQTLSDTVYDVGIIRAVLHHLPDDSQALAIQNASQRCRRLIISNRTATTRSSNYSKNFRSTILSMKKKVIPVPQPSFGADNLIGSRSNSPSSGLCRHSFPNCQPVSYTFYNHFLKKCHSSTPI